MNTASLAKHLRQTRKNPPHVGFVEFDSDTGIEFDTGSEFGDKIAETAADAAIREGGEFVKDAATKYGGETAGNIAGAVVNETVDQLTEGSGLDSDSDSDSDSGSLESQVSAVRQAPGFEAGTLILQRNKDRIAQVAREANRKIRQTQEAAGIASATPDEIRQAYVASIQRQEAQASAAKRKKTLWIVGGTVLGLIVVGGGVYYATKE